MKIAVYTIAKNEAQFVQRWADSCAEADYRLILDTGSTDDTVTIAEQAGVACHVQTFSPWRFDHARNAALDLLPDNIDICVALDMDEMLEPGWRSHLEQIPTGTTRPRYKYVWSWNDDGTEGLVYGGDKIHARHGYRWKHPVHEVLKPLGPEHQHWVPQLEIHHHPDSSKSRGQYFDLLKLAVEEEPGDDRNQFYLGREYFYHGQYDEAINHLNRHLELSRWAPERAASYRMLYKMTGRVEMLYLALAESPLRRETLVELSMHYYRQQAWAECRQFAVAATAIAEKPLDYLCEAEAWGALPWDLLAFSAYHLGRPAEAIVAGRKACDINPTDLRLAGNLDYYKAAL